MQPQTRQHPTSPAVTEPCHPQLPRPDRALARAGGIVGAVPKPVNNRPEPPWPPHASPPLDPGAVLRAVRQHAKLSQRELADVSGVPLSTIVRIESADRAGRHLPPHLRHVRVPRAYGDNRGEWWGWSRKWSSLPGAHIPQLTYWMRPWSSRRIARPAETDHYDS